MHCSAQAFAICSGFCWVEGLQMLMSSVDSTRASSGFRRTMSDNGRSFRSGSQTWLHTYLTFWSVGCGWDLPYPEQESHTPGLASTHTQLSFGIFKLNRILCSSIRGCGLFDSSNEEVLTHLWGRTKTWQGLRAVREHTKCCFVIFNCTNVSSCRSSPCARVCCSIVCSQ